MGNIQYRNLGPEPLKGRVKSGKKTEKYIERLRMDRVEHLENKIDRSASSVEVHSVSTLSSRGGSIT